MNAQPKLRSVTQIMAKAGNLPAEVHAPAKQLDPGTTEVVNALFKELQAIFPAWKQAWPDDEALKAAKRSWIKSFVAAGINTLEQIRFGIQKCRVLGTDFAPSSGKFIKLCQPTPEEMGIPPLARALAEALENFHPSRAGARQWSHAAVGRQPETQQQQPCLQDSCIAHLLSYPLHQPGPDGVVLRFWPGPQRAGPARRPPGGSRTVQFVPRLSRPGRPPPYTVGHPRPAPGRSATSTRPVQASPAVPCGLPVRQVDRLARQPMCAVIQVLDATISDEGVADSLLAAHPVPA